MVNQESLNKLYELIISCHELTTKELNNCGFNSKDLSDLIENETLTRIRRGYYTFLKVDDLYNYGKKLASLKKYDAATACFKKCYQLDPNNTQVCFQLFFRCVINSNYNKIFEYFDKFYDDCEFCNYDNNFYLYLLSMITELPEKHREYAKFLRFEDVRVDFKDNDAKTQNRIRALALNQKFSLALKQLNDLGSQYGKLNIQNIIIKSLLKKTIEKQTLVRENLINLINERKYEGVIEYLESIQEYHRLGEVNEIVLTLTEDLIGIAKKGIIPEKQIFTTDKLFEAITGKNYELALLLCEEYNDKNNIKSNSNVIYMLLEEINNLINKKEKIELPIKEKNEKVKDMKESIEEISTDNLVSNDDIYVNIVNYLMKNDLDNAFITLKSYLKNFNKSEFEFLIINLIKISLMEKDIAFTKPMIVLTYISRDNFQFNVLEYIQDFYEAISKNEYDKARIYLDIIAKSSVLEDTNELAIRLEQLLNGLEKNKSQNEVVEIKEEKNSQNEEKQLEETKIIKNTSTVMIKKDENQEFINSKLNELFENGIVVLKPMNKERRIKIHNIVNSIRDVESFSIGVESNRQIVLRFKPYLEEYINISKLANEGRKAYKLGDYDLCINKYRQLLEFGKPKAWVYAQIGLSYMKKIILN